MTKSNIKFVRISRETADKLQVVSRKYNVSFQELIDEVVTEYLIVRK